MTMRDAIQQQMDDAALDVVAANIVASRAGGAVERCHGIRHLGSYSNAAHQWGVAMLLHYLYPQHFARCVLHALTHDVPEFIFGDVPAPSMRYVPGMAKGLKSLEAAYAQSIGLPAEGDGLTEDEFRALKSCDRLELYLWCCEQQAMGNQFASECRRELARYFTEENGLDAAGLAFWRRMEAGYNSLSGPSVVPEQAGVAQRIVKTLTE